jgi:hypothetical protein
MSLLRKSAFLLFAFSAITGIAQTIPATQAGSRVGQQATVCGKIAETHTASTTRGTPTFIDFEKAYPDQVFTAVIWERDKVRVGNLPKVGELCVKGTITEYHGRPEIVLHSRSDWSSSQSRLSNNNHYTNVDGQSVHSPAYSSGGIPAGATAQCGDGTYSFSQHRRGTCSHHGGVAKWL